MENSNSLKPLSIIPNWSNIFIHVEGDEKIKHNFFDMIKAYALDTDDAESFKIKNLIGTFVPYSAAENIICENPLYALALVTPECEVIAPITFNSELTMQKFNGSTLMCLVDFKDFSCYEGDPIIHSKKSLQKLLGCYVHLFPELDIYIGYKRLAVRNPETKEKLNMSEIVSEYVYKGKKYAHSCRREAETFAFYTEKELIYDIEIIKILPIKINDSGDIFHQYVKMGTLKRFRM